jgi:endo-1,4-beta-mannosidase
MKLNPVVYDKKKTLTSEEYLYKENGFIAQELQLIIPNAVIEGNDENKLLSINYISLIPVLTKAIQELNKVNEEQQKIIKQQKIEYLKLLKRIEALEK